MTVTVTHDRMRAQAYIEVDAVPIIADGERPLLFRIDWEHLRDLALALDHGRVDSVTIDATWHRRLYWGHLWRGFEGEMREVVAAAEDRFDRAIDDLLRRAAVDRVLAHDAQQDARMFRFQALVARIDARPTHPIAHGRRDA